MTRLAMILVLLRFGVFAAPAQDWQNATELPNVDLSGLTAAQKTSVMKVLRSQFCYCGCGMHVAECRMKDPPCTYSQKSAKVIIEAIKDGKTEQDAYDASSPKLLDDAVNISVKGSPVRGPESAKITIIEFSDFQCPYCLVATPEIKALLKAYPTQAKLIFKEYPLETHSQAFIAATSALAANKQGKFWQMHDAMFEHHDDLTRPELVKIAGNLGLDVARFEKDMDSAETKDAIAKDVDDGDKAGVQGTPTIFINGQHYNGPIAFNYLKQILDQMLKAQQR